MINIIACDDDADIVRALKIYLSSEGYNVFEAHNGKDVLRLLAENDVQLVLMDVMMPQMDGIETTAEIRKKYNVPVILITAKSEDYDKILGLNVGADDYITKPFNPVEVVARSKSHFGGILNSARLRPVSRFATAEFLLTIFPKRLSLTVKRSTSHRRNTPFSSFLWKILTAFYRPRRFMKKYGMTAFSEAKAQLLYISVT